MSEPGHARAAHSRKTRELILRAAVALFAGQGFAATTTLEIAREAGVSHGSVFAHFGSREGLLACVISEFGREMAARTHELARRGQGVRSVLEAHLESLREHEELYTRLVAERTLLPPEVRPALVAIHSAVSLHLAEAAEREVAAGRLRPVATHLLFNTWIALVHYYLANRDLFAPGESVIGRCGEELVEHYVGLLAPGGTAP